MPELPDLEIIREVLAPRLTGQPQVEYRALENGFLNLPEAC